MSWYEILLGVILIVTAISLVAVVLMQEGRADGLGAIAGGAETFLGKNKGRTVEQKLVKITKALAVVFFVLSLLATLIVLFVK
ncbi:MAG: preprotein translocase subunit SecG [Clostridia bacterium]|nr:preprotein translocase subunit SecG [Clostridia bacterium]MBQ6466423.1 preprotein translocase subunit SecG [Clostridia bacterium]MBR6335134.1 preprotein translocase subunit SecG [Clostridia bacterium]